MQSRLFFVCLVAAAIANPGCSESGPQMYSISGVATHQGQPLPGLYIMFRPDDKTTSTDAAAITDPQGRFTLRVGSRPGAFPGPHTVIVADPAALQGGKTDASEGFRTAVQKYGANSTLRVTIDKDDENLELKLD